MVLNIAGQGRARHDRFVRRHAAQVRRDASVRIRVRRRLARQALRRGQRLTRLIAIFAGLCISIACLGLFGLASFMAAQRTREIGVRKVFGARTGQIITLLAHRIVYLVLGAAAVASVLSYRRDEGVARELRVPRRHQPADLRRGGARGARHRVSHGGAAVDEGRARASRDLATLRMKAAASCTSRTTRLRWRIATSGVAG